MSGMRRNRVTLTDDFRRLLIVCQVKDGQHIQRESDDLLHLQDCWGWRNGHVIQNLDMN